MREVPGSIPGAALVALHAHFPFGTAPKRYTGRVLEQPPAPALRDQTLGRHLAPHFIEREIIWWMVYHFEKGRINVSGATNKRIHINRALCNSFFHFLTQQNIHAERKEKTGNQKRRAHKKRPRGESNHGLPASESGGFPCRRATSDLCDVLAG